MFAVIGLGNDYEGIEALGDFNEINLGTEYYYLGLHFACIQWTIRASIGDFTCIDVAATLTFENTVVFWFIWFFVLIATCIVFLNFIVAEASHSYTIVIEKVD